jgi:tetratricopeptide (TPR) repeat protein
MKKQTLLVLFLVWIVTIPAVAGKSPDKEVIKAYQLRIVGKVDEAKQLLDGILSKDSTNAMAHYEMARLKHYLLLGGGAKMEEVVVSINKAVSYDPQNVTYAYYKAIVSFLNAFMSMQTGSTEVKKHIEETCILFKKVLNLKPDYYEASMYLVEIYGLLPKDMGGDSLKATEYARLLVSSNGYFGARASAVLAPKGTDLVKFWKDQVDHSKDAGLLVEMGKAFLNAGNPDQAEKYFEEAMKADPSMNIEILDLARYHIYKVMQNKDLAAKELPIAKVYLEKYLHAVPEPIVPLKAYTIGLMTLTEMFQGNKAEADRLMEEAKALDKYFSRATGIPNLLLFDSPEQQMHHYFSFFSPF